MEFWSCTPTATISKVREGTKGCAHRQREQMSQDGSKVKPGALFTIPNLEKAEAELNALTATWHLATRHS